MRLVFVSLMSGIQWGGSEALWSKTAQLAINKGHQVLVSVYDWGSLHPELQKLKSLGAIIHLRQRFNNEANIFNKTWNHFKNRINWLNNTYMPIIHVQPDHIVINQGDCF